MEIHLDKSNGKRVSLENIQTNMKVAGLTSLFQVCIVYFLVFWGPGEFGLKTERGLTPTFEQSHFFTVILEWWLYPNGSVKFVGKKGITKKCINLIQG